MAITLSFECRKKHNFEILFPSSKEADNQEKKGLICCPECDSNKVKRLLSAPNVNTGKSRRPGADTAAAERDVAPKVEYENVRDRFYRTMINISEGKEEDRLITGQATADQAQELVERGLPVYQVTPEVKRHMKIRRAKRDLN